MLKGQKKKKSFWKFGQEGLQTAILLSKEELFVWTAVARELVIGGANKLAEVLEQVLGLKKCKKSFEKFGLEGLERWSLKTDAEKS